jgi:hypothetical protein
MDFATALTMFCLVSPNKGYGQGLNAYRGLLLWGTFGLDPIPMVAILTWVEDR